MNRKKAFYLVLIFLALVIFNIIVLGLLFGLMHEFDYSQPEKWVQYITGIAFIFFGPIIFLMSEIDANFGIKDYWYYIGIVINALLWSSLVMYFFGKVRQLKTSAL